MFLQMMWFVVNILFVVALIIMLFVHRAVGTARLNGDMGKLKRITTQRNILAAVTVLLFVGMCIVFLTNMRVNG